MGKNIVTWQRCSQNQPPGLALFGNIWIDRCHVNVVCIMKVSTGSRELLGGSDKLWKAGGSLKDSDGLQKHRVNMPTVFSCSARTVIAFRCG